MIFRDARLKLLAYVRDQVRNGEITERGFARLIGISQPHAHNVLKGVRSLSPDLCDAALKCLHLSLLDLAPLDEMEAQLQQRRRKERPVMVPFLDSVLGPGRPWTGRVDWRKNFPLPLLSANPPIEAELRMAELGADPAMCATLKSCDFALLDTSMACRSTISPRELYVVERGGEAVLRFIRSGACTYYLVTDADFDDPTAWQRLERSTVKASGLVKGRVLWLGRERDRDRMA